MASEIEVLESRANAPNQGVAAATLATRYYGGAAMAHEAIYNTVLGILGNINVGRVLDVPAGEGALAARMTALGIEVQCCDLYPELFKLSGTEIRRGDLAVRLEYDDESFDTVICVEGLEHTENPLQAIRELARLLKPGGHLIISVPNILNIEERVKWLLFGYTSHFKPLSADFLRKGLIGFAEHPEVVLHINPIGYSELRYALEKSGFRIQSTYRDKPKARLWLYWPIVGFIRLIARFTPRQRRKERWTDEIQSDEVLLGGNTLVFLAKKL